MKHDVFCNCEDCWWIKGQRETCATCGCIVGSGCPCSTEKENQKIDGMVGYGHVNENAFKT